MEKFILPGNFCTVQEGFRFRLLSLWPTEIDKMRNKNINCSPYKTEYSCRLKVAAPLLGFRIGSCSGVCDPLALWQGRHQDGEVAGPGDSGGGVAVLETPLLQAVESPNLSFTCVKAKR